MGSIKDRNGMVLTEAEIFRRGGKNTEKDYTKKDLYDPDNQDGVITHLESEILECEVKWALGSISTNRASGGDGIQLTYFKSKRMMLWKYCPQYASKFGELSSDDRTGKVQFLFKLQRKAMLKNVESATQFHSSHMLAN